MMFILYIFEPNVFFIFLYRWYFKLNLFIFQLNKEFCFYLKQIYDALHSTPALVSLFPYVRGQWKTNSIFLFPLYHEEVIVWYCLKIINRSNVIQVKYFSNFRKFFKEEKDLLYDLKNAYHCSRISPI